RLDERVPLRHRVDDRIADVAAQLPASEDEAVRPDPVEAHGPGDRLRERQEAARHQKAARSARAHGLDEGFRAGSNLDPLVEAALERALVEAGEKPHALTQRSGEIQLALHRALGDPRDLVLEPGIIGELVDAFLA